jgi:hypothetical protein
MTHALDEIRLDLPCQVPWDTMAGDDRASGSARNAT